MVTEEGIISDLWRIASRVDDNGSAGPLSKNRLMSYHVVENPGPGLAGVIRGMGCFHNDQV